MGLEAIAKGISGELKTRFVNSLFLGNSYQVFNSVIIDTEEGSTQIDHIIVSRFGLFAVETKEKSGWIYGDPKQKQWTQTYFGTKYRFQNPLHQNYLHTKSLSAYLGVDHDKIHSLVIFWGDFEFKTPMPDNVCKGGILNPKFLNYIRSKNQVLLSPEEIETTSSRLKEAKDNSGLLRQIRHVVDVKAKHDDRMKCPKCGGTLVERVSTRGKNSGGKFLGCSNYPKCRYVRDL